MTAEHDGISIFNMYIDEWEIQKNTNLSVISTYYEKRRHIGFGPSGLRDSDWTPVIITFLDILGCRAGYAQLYERQMPGKKNWDRDCIWRSFWSNTHQVSIEVENAPLSVFGPNREVAMLMKDVAPLKILVTYPPTEAPRQISSPATTMENYLKMLYKEITKSTPQSNQNIEFLLIIGDNVKKDIQGSWRGYLLSRNKERWETDWSTL